MRVAFDGGDQPQKESANGCRAQVRRLIPFKGPSIELKSINLIPYHYEYSVEHLILRSAPVRQILPHTASQKTEAQRV